MKTNREELKIEAYLAEYQKLRDEMLFFQGSLQQNVLLALGSASVAIPILLGQTTNIPTNIIAILLYALAIVYAVLGINYAHASYTIGVIGKYIHEYLEPAINQAILSSEYPALNWETYIRNERGRFPDLILSGIGPIGSMILLLLPGGVALFSSQYVLLVPSIQSSQQSPALQYISFWLLPLSIITWVMFAVTILSFIFIAIYHPIKTKSLIIK